MDSRPCSPNLPEGCRFAPRCPYVADKCYEAYPTSHHLAEGHYADCWALDADWDGTPHRGIHTAHRKRWVTVGGTIAFYKR